MTSTRRHWTWLLTSLALAICALSVAPAPSSPTAVFAADERRPAIAAEVVAHGDACGNSAVQAPDAGPSFDFHEACHGHDECYGLGGGESERRACDLAFLRAMLAACDAQNPRFSAAWFQCRSVATLYYGAVRLGGWLFFY